MEETAPLLRVLDILNARSPYFTGFGIRVRGNQNAVNHTEDRVGSANSKRKREQGNGRQSQTQPHYSQAVAKILPKFQCTPSPHVSGYLPCQFKIAEVAARLAPRRLGWLAALHPQLRFFGDVEPEFLVQFVIFPRSPGKPTPESHSSVLRFTRAA